MSKMKPHDIKKLKMAMSLAKSVCRAGGEISTDELLEMSVIDLIDRLGPNDVIFIHNGGEDE